MNTLLIQKSTQKLADLLARTELLCGYPRKPPLDPIEQELQDIAFELGRASLSLIGNAFIDVNRIAHLLEKIANRRVDTP